MIDESNAMTLSEINGRYPSAFQKLGYDILLDVDSTYKTKIISTMDICVNTIITLLLMKPGQYPSIPELGIDIDQYLHEYADDPSIPATIVSKLYDQCNRLQIVVGLDIECFIERLSNGMNALIVQVTANDRISYGSTSNKVLIGISYNKLNDIYVKKTYVK